MNHSPVLTTDVSCRCDNIKPTHIFYCCSLRCKYQFQSINSPPAPTAPGFSPPFELAPLLDGEPWFSYFRREILKHLVHFSSASPRSFPSPLLAKHRSDSVSRPTKWKIQKEISSDLHKDLAGWDSFASWHFPKKYLSKAMRFNVPLAFPLIDSALLG